MINNKYVYLVSLDSDTKRRETLALQFKNEYKNFKHISAVDGRKLSAKEFYGELTKYYINNNRLISPSELGCTLSHVKVLEEFLKTDEKYALILEDDVIGSDEDINKIFQLAEQLDENSLFICGGQEGLGSKRYLLGKETKICNLFKLNHFSYSIISRTCCYVVTRESAKQILKHQKNKLTVADKWDNLLEESLIEIYYSNILSHPEDLSDSHIETERAIFYKRNFLSKDILYRITRKLYRELVTIYLKIKGDKLL